MLPRHRLHLRAGKSEEREADHGETGGLDEERGECKWGSKSARIRKS